MAVEEIGVDLHRQWKGILQSNCTNKLAKKGCMINVIGDEDSSMKKIHDQHDADVTKYSDFSYVKRTLYNK